MDTNRRRRMKEKRLRRKVALGLVSLIAPVLIGSGVSASSMPAQNTDKRFSISIAYEQMDADPIAKWYEQLNQDWRDGKYTFLAPIPDWQDMQSPKIRSAIDVEAKYRIIKGKNFSLGLVAGIESGSGNTSYNKTYSLSEEDLIFDFNIDRKESINFNNKHAGLEAELKRGRLSFALTASTDSYDVNGNADLTMKVAEQPYPPHYTQWRNASYKGKGQGTSFGAAIRYAINKTINLFLGFSKRQAKIKTEGEEEIRISTNPGWVGTTDYSPEFNMDSTSWKAGIEINL